MLIGILGTAYFVISLIGGFADKYDFYTDIAYLAAGIFGLLMYFYYTKDRWFGQRFKEKAKAMGEKFPAKVIYAEYRIKSRQTEYYLIIEFYENGERKLLKSKAYADDPNRCIKYADCMVYKYKNKYHEGGLQTLNVKLHGTEVEERIPIKFYEPKITSKNKYV